MAQLQRMDRLADELVDAGDAGAIADIDLDEVRELMGDESAQDLQALQDLAKALEEAGYAEQQGERLELTPRGSRRLGPAGARPALRQAAQGRVRRARPPSIGRRRRAHRRIDGLGVRPPVPPRPAAHPRQTPSCGPRTRVEARAAREGGRLLLSPSDFSVFQTEELSDAATVLLVDMSRSMLLRGCFLAAKKVAVALDTLIRTQFPRDRLHVIGFAYYAREIRPEALATLSWHGYEYGTNLQHGLMLGRRLLARDHSANKQIMVITDGEPTAHFEDGQVEFSYPPTRRTIVETLREVVRCTREGITINTFMLERSTRAGRVRRPPDAPQPRPRLLRQPRGAGRVRAGRLRGSKAQASLIHSAWRATDQSPPQDRALWFNRSGICRWNDR